MRGGAAGEEGEEEHRQPAEREQQAEDGDDGEGAARMFEDGEIDVRGFPWGDEDRHGRPPFERYPTFSPARGGLSDLSGPAINSTSEAPREDHGDQHRSTRYPPRAGGRHPSGHRATAAARRPQGRLREEGLLRRVAAEPVAEREPGEDGPRRGRSRRVGELRGGARHTRHTPHRD